MAASHPASQPQAADALAASQLQQCARQVSQLRQDSPALTAQSEAIERERDAINRRTAELDAEDARIMGLVNRVVPAAELMAEAKKLAQQLASKAPVAARRRKLIAEMSVPGAKASSIRSKRRSHKPKDKRVPHHIRTTCAPATCRK